MQNNPELRLTTGPVFRGLLGFVLPYLLTSLLQVLYGVVDTYTVGAFADAASISAVSVGSKIFSMATVVVIGLSTGAMVLIGRVVGEGNHRGAAAAVGNTILFFLLFAAVLTPLMLLLIPNLVQWVRTPAEAAPAAGQYVFICACGLPFVIAYNLICSILRAIGDSKTPLIFVAVACILNVGLDFLLVGACAMGAPGAAVATAAAQSAAAVCGVLYLLRRRLPFPVSFRDLRCKRPVMGEILRIGLPVAVQDGCLHVCFIVLAAIANLRGVTDSAAVGIVETIINGVFLVPCAFEAAVVTMTAQNLGANKPERIRAAVGYSLVISTAFGAAVALACNLWGGPLTGVFTEDPAVIAAGASYLRGYSMDTMLVGVSFMISGYLCGTGRAGVVFLQNMLAIVLVRLPVAYVMSRLFPDTLFFMGLSSPGGTAFSIVFFLIYLAATGDMLLHDLGRTAERKEQKNEHS